VLPNLRFKDVLPNLRFKDVLPNLRFIVQEVHLLHNLILFYSTNIDVL